MAHGPSTQNGRSPPALKPSMKKLPGKSLPNHVSVQSRPPSAPAPKRITPTPRGVTPLVGVVDTGKNRAPPPKRKPALHGSSFHVRSGMSAPSATRTQLVPSED